MFKFFALAFVALIACASAKPGIVAPLAYSAPLVAAAPAAAVYSREYHGNFAAPYVTAASPYVASPYVASPYVASPYVASPYVASPYVASPYVASPYTAAYSAAPVLLRK
ncbi:cuticle protein 16.5-like [Drosophila miranda]|uniref:cuticle protein 16.5-like n=1 Tax=Drosophila miranda TaxID=7229 RepID=UPI0007E7221B|nr:cuticle protein 16.5-like [Drosophila miranda]XP_017139360.1 cuticle protein 16.5-like [Drosophila miranda]